MLSALFTGDAILQAVFDDLDRISPSQHRQSEATRLVQEALLIWDPLCLPASGADGDYGGPGSETGEAVMRFKRDELGVPPAEIFNDIGPRTVKRLDEIAATREHGLDLAFALVTQPGLDQAQSAAIGDAIAAAGGSLLLTLGERVAVVHGEDPVRQAIEATVGGLIAGIVTPAAPQAPPGLDPDTLELLEAWLASFDPLFLAGLLDSWANPVPFASGPCDQGAMGE